MHPNSTAPIPVWDAAVRLLHWTLVGAIATAWTSTLDIGVPADWHERAGYTAMGCVALRLLWGFFGSPHARFADFVRGPRSTWRYAVGRKGGAGEADFVRYLEQRFARDGHRLTGLLRTIANSDAFYRIAPQTEEAAR